MGRKKKLQRFAELLSMPNVLENPDPLMPKLIRGPGEEPDLRGKWAGVFFENENPLVLELACGRGDYTLGLARRFHQTNFIGVDIKGARIWKGAKAALEESLDNVAFLRTRIECLDHFFAAGEVSQIWITFPDPFPKKTSENRRLTALHFLEKYRKVLNPRGVVHLKTDDKAFFDYTRETVAESTGWREEYCLEDIYSETLPLEELEILTHYEKKHLSSGKKIYYLRFTPK